MTSDVNADLATARYLTANIAVSSTTTTATANAQRDLTSSVSISSTTATSDAEIWLLYLNDLPPDAITTQTNLTGVVGNIQDDPDSPDGNWLTVSDETQDTVLLATFPTPELTLYSTQTFKVLLRKTVGDNNPTATIQLYENGGLVRAGSPISITSLTGQVETFEWDASEVSNPANVEIRIVGAAT